ncbi:MAG: DUF134 domain-containing protein [Kiritimatiellae bacterium]|nr:DUF134 domain-containing protein [Kiritimatiellia bacterium]
MPGRHCIRRVERPPDVTYFKPAGTPVRLLQEIALTLDEYEAVRLADLEGLYQEQAAGKMGVSRPTFSRIVGSARKKIADALVNGKALRIGGGPVMPVSGPGFGGGRRGGGGGGRGRGRGFGRGC